MPVFPDDAPRASLHAAGISDFRFPAGGAYAFVAVETTNLLLVQGPWSPRE
jgi:hypothetical protein